MRIIYDEKGVKLQSSMGEIEGNSFLIRALAGLIEQHLERKGDSSTNTERILVYQWDIEDEFDKLASSFLPVSNDTKIKENI